MVLSLNDLVLFVALPRFDDALPPLVVSRIRSAVVEPSRLLHPQPFANSAVQQATAIASTPSQRALGAGPAVECCWGVQEMSEIRVGHQACTPGFSPGQPHLQHKFCHTCRQGFAVDARCVRVLPDEGSMRNSTKEGFWTNPAGGGGVPFRVINQVKRLKGPTLVVFKGEAPEKWGADEWGAMPEGVARDDGTVWLCVAYNTLTPIPKGSVRFPEGRRSVISVDTAMESSSHSRSSSPSFRAENSGSVGEETMGKRQAVDVKASAGLPWTTSAGMPWTMRAAPVSALSATTFVPATIPATSSDAIAPGAFSSVVAGAQDELGRAAAATAGSSEKLSTSDELLGHFLDSFMEWEDDHGLPAGVDASASADCVATVGAAPTILIDPRISPPTSPPSPHPCPLEPAAAQKSVSQSHAAASERSCPSVITTWCIAAVLGVVIADVFALPSGQAMAPTLSIAHDVAGMIGQLITTQIRPLGLDPAALPFAEAAPAPPAVGLDGGLPATAAALEAMCRMRVLQLCVLPLPLVLWAAAAFPDKPPKRGLPVIHAVGALQVTSRLCLAVSQHYRTVDTHGEGAQAVVIHRCAANLWLLVALARALATTYRGGAFFWASLRITTFALSAILTVTLLTLRWIEPPPAMYDYPPAGVSFEGGLAVAASMCAYGAIFCRSVRNRVAIVCAAAAAGSARK